MPEGVTLSTTVGRFAGIDFGGTGQDVLLLHNSGSNAEAMRPLGERLSEQCHAVAVDIRGHGQTVLDLGDRREGWSDLGPICAALGMTAPVLVGEGTMAWMSIAATLHGIVTPPAVILLDGFPFVRSGAASRAMLEAMTDPAVLEELARRTYFGRRLAESDIEAFLAEAAEASKQDWLLRSVPPEQFRAQMLRSLVPVEDGTYAVQPTLDTVRRLVDISPGLDPFPCAETFERVTVPLLFIDPRDVLADGDIAAIDAVVAAAPNRRASMFEGVGFLAVRHARQIADDIGALLLELRD